MQDLLGTIARHSVETIVLNCSIVPAAHCRGQAVVQRFAASLDCNSADMSASIREGTFRVGRFHQFLIRDPKERVITAPCSDERVLHHAIMNVSEPVMERWLLGMAGACYSRQYSECMLKGIVQRSMQLPPWTLSAQ